VSYHRFLSHAFVDTSIVTRAIKAFIVVAMQGDLPRAYHGTYNRGRSQGRAVFRLGEDVASVELVVSVQSVAITVIPYYARLAGAMAPPGP
jgi:hypothetical protein